MNMMHANDALVGDLTIKVVGLMTHFITEIYQPILKLTNEAIFNSVEAFVSSSLKLKSLTAHLSLHEIDLPPFFTYLQMFSACSHILL